MPAAIAETARLRLRGWEAADVDRMLAHLNTAAVMRHLGGPLGRADYEAAFQRCVGYEQAYGHTFWVLERRADDAFLGFCGLKRVNAAGTALTGQFEIGWRLREDAWGQGYAREAATEALRLAFERFDAPIVHAFTIAANTASQALMRRLGMARRPELDFVDPSLGPDLNPTIVHSLEKSAWKASRS